MRDLNFFEPYIDKKSTKISFLSILYSLIGLSLLIVIILGVYNQLKISNLNKDVNYREAIVNDPQTVKKVEEIKKFDEEVAQFKSEVEKIVALDKNIVENENITPDLFKEISKKLPEGVFISSLQASNANLSISGFSMDRYSIAEFQKGLETIDIITSTFVPSITKVDSYYRFDISAGIKEVQEDGTEEQKGE
ncbi:PilN domain-containing protein [Soehngenia saccharolytica]|nr:PilN domain-containing protein [Soehngenia saccharolytica]